MKNVSFLFSCICTCYIACCQIPSSGNVLWLRSDQGVYNDNGVTNAVIGNTVQFWADQSGSGHHFTQASAAQRPEFQVQTNLLCSRPVIRFDPGRSTVLTSSSLLLSGAKSIFIVFQLPPMSGAANDLISIKGNSDEFTEIVATDFAGYTPVTFIADLASTPGGGFFQPSAGVNTSFSAAGNLLSLIYDGGTNTAISSYDAYYDAAMPPVVSSGLLGRYNNDISSIGARAPFQNINYLRGDMAEVIVYNRVLSTPEKDQVENYLISKYGFFGTCVVLPLTLFDFTALQAGNTVQLDWKVADEEGIKEYIPEHSKDGVHWDSLTALPSKKEHQGINQYHYIHTRPATGVNYYRFRMKNIDGRDKYGPVRKVTMPAQSTTVIRVFPSPTTGFVQIRSLEREEWMYVTVMNSEGKKLMGKKMMGQGQLDISGFPQGIYFIQVIGKTIHRTEKIIKQ